MSGRQGTFVPVICHRCPSFVTDAHHLSLHNCRKQRDSQQPPDGSQGQSVSLDTVWCSQKLDSSVLTWAEAPWWSGRVAVNLARSPCSRTPLWNPTPNCSALTSHSTTLPPKFKATMATKPAEGQIPAENFSRKPTQQEHRKPCGCTQPWPLPALLSRPIPRSLQWTRGRGLRRTAGLWRAGEDTFRKSVAAWTGPDRSVSAG